MGWFDRVVVIGCLAVRLVCLSLLLLIFPFFLLSFLHRALAEEGVLAGCSQVAELFGEAVVAAGELGVVAAEDGQVAETSVAVEGVAEDLVVVFAAAVLFARCLFDVVGLDGGLDAREPFETPGDVGDLFDDVVFEGVDRAQVGAELVEFALVVGRVFAGDEGVWGAESVLEGVLRGTLFALVGARTGGFLCIALVGATLCSGRHKNSPGGGLRPLYEKPRILKAMKMGDRPRRAA